MTGNFCEFEFCINCLSIDCPSTFNHASSTTQSPHLNSPRLSCPFYSDFNQTTNNAELVHAATKAESATTSSSAKIKKRKKKINQQ